MRRKPRGISRLKLAPSQEGRRSANYQAGLQAGYNQGLQAGQSSYHSLFEGTSIIIPSYNQVNYLRGCIDSIIDNTEQPHEIIVVDNASTDGTAEYLEQLDGQVRFRVLDQNYGFAGAVNMGLMMAKGTTMLILNNDTLVTDNWLGNLLICLHSDPTIGMVGPVTNYISGDQQIKVPYEKIDDMPEFARLNNISDPKRWERTDRLPGFCLLFRRELWERIGFLDEGFEFGNYEDDDYNIRTRLLGYSLVIARDSFIHHFGSVSIKALGDQLEQVTTRNMVYYMTKWNNPYAWIHQVRASESHIPVLATRGETAFYPEGVVVKGIGAQAFWIENGVKHPIEGEWSGPVVRLPQVLIRSWMTGTALAAVEAESKWQSLHRVHRGAPLHGQITSGLDGFLYYLENGTKRKIITEAAAAAWCLNERTQYPLTVEQLQELPEGLPLIPPVKLRQVL
ncbi:glycosyltransferase family 2 protein [Paenibacillus glycanilyticus]|uniref:glycosyltransferase family 2 protein n=1 Tax=Paenibacillus glycanilyticus TaxID=126569 RepID=UPI00203E7172|nr:glycosyltransferase family 2 protein [Paenibacillus glycanilyticus]MCM3629006.1 glycosyltransferase family 2 protein [Paenibacillus glycanilyticus]